MASVMIVDDSDAIRMVLKDIVTIGKHNLVGELQNGVGALEEYIKVKPEVVLLDMAMPKKDGVSVLKEIIGYDPDANVIMISASDNQETVKECLSLGAKAYILKPFNFQEVLDTIIKVAN
ncbi:MAG: response regulator [Nitrosopumilales archaeon]|nr:MAG: response regulator [Nitrosopumilales archaeon]